MSSTPAAAHRITDEGNGPALLFLHHFGGSQYCWRRVIDRLVDRHRCIAPDLPGFGSSDRYPGPFTNEACADHIIALISELGLSDYGIVGHSMGGKIALAIAARDPPGLGHLVLLAPSPPTPEPIPDADRAHLLVSWGDRDAMAAIVEKITVRRLSLQERERLVADMLAASREAWEAWLNHGSREDISASVERIAIPMAVVAGGGDQTIPVAVLRRELLRSSPTATMEIVADAGHLLPLEAGDQVAAIIRSSTRERANSTKEGAGCTA